MNWMVWFFKKKSIKRTVWSKKSRPERLNNSILQGISYWNIFYELTLTYRNMQARFYLKVVLKSWGSDIWVSSTSFQKSNIGWPQQPPTEIGPKIQHDISGKKEIIFLFFSFFLFEGASEILRFGYLSFINQFSEK